MADDLLYTPRYSIPYPSPDAHPRDASDHWSGAMLGVEAALEAVNLPPVIDTGWIDLPLEPGIEPYDSSSLPQIRREGNVVSMCGMVKGTITPGMTICYLAQQFRPRLYRREGGATSAGVLQRINISNGTGGVSVNVSGSGNVSWVALDSVGPWRTD